MSQSFTGPRVVIIEGGNRIGRGLAVALMVDALERQGVQATRAVVSPTTLGPRGRVDLGGLVFPEPRPPSSERRRVAQWKEERNGRR